MVHNFDELTPELILTAVEDALGIQCSPVTIPFPSYINRVYELRLRNTNSVVVKFYRPGRWSKAALEEEHQFMLACIKMDLPIAAPLKLKNGTTLGCTANGIYFAVYPKKSGRRFEVNSLDDWSRFGMLCAKLHNAGDLVSTVAHRPVLTPEHSTRQAVSNLLKHDFIPAAVKNELARLTGELIEAVQYETDCVGLTAVHGDLHSGNILERPGEGLLLIDFDDMAVAPAAQDLWPLLPDYAMNCQTELSALVNGYRCFRDLDSVDWHLLEGLRGMHMVYYLDWCAKQYNDYMFERTFPEWGNAEFWRTELTALTRQLDVICERNIESDGQTGYDAGQDEEECGAWEY